MTRWNGKKEARTGGEMARTEPAIKAPDIDTPQIKQLARQAEADTITALSGASTQAFRLSHARQRAGVAELCPVADIDFGFVHDDQRLERVRLVERDMDSPLIRIEVLD